MEDIALIFVLFMIFALGYFIMKKIDSFTEENSRLITAWSRENSLPVRAAGKTPAPCESTAPEAKHCRLKNGAAVIRPDHFIA